MNRSYSQTWAQKRHGSSLFFFFFGTASGVALACISYSIFSSRLKPDKPLRSPERPQEATRPRIVCFGDSLTQFGFDPERTGWLAFLAHWWERRFDVLNRGFSGYNTRWVLPLAEKIFVRAAHDVRLVIIFLGANDSVTPGNFQHVPLDEYKENLKRLQLMARTAYPGARILLITPPPIQEAKWAANRREKGGVMDRTQDHTKFYAEACSQIGQETSIPTVDAYSLMGAGDTALASKYFHDGLHFTAEGNQILFEGVKTKILDEFPELDPESDVAPPIQAPHFSEVDPDNIHGSVLGKVKLES